MRPAAAPTGRRHRPRPTLLLALLLTSGCATATPSPTGGADDGSVTAAPPGTLTVAAAASLTDVLTTIAADLTATGGPATQLSFGSSTLVGQQVEQGAPIDVLVVADPDSAIPADLRGASSRVDFARTRLQIATPADDPADVSGVGDLARREVDVVLCVASAPCGRAADAMLAAAGVTAHVVSRELNVRATLAKVRLGEVDAAVVYRTDVVAAGPAVRGVDIPAAVDVAVDYGLVVVRDSPAAQAFIAAVTGAAGSQALRAAGFEPLP